MNCASVTITGGGGRESIPFNRRPNILRAHAGTDCNIAEGFDVEYPDPGPDVTRFPQTKLIAPVGSACGTSNPGGGGGGGGIGGGFGSVSPNNPNGGGPFADGPAVPVPISQFGSDPSIAGDRAFGGAVGSGGDGVAPPLGGAPAPGPFGSHENVCGGAMRYSCINSIFGSCCNAQGQCGTRDMDCTLPACQPLFGRCMDERGNPNVGFRGRSSGYVEEPDMTTEWMVAALVVTALYMIV